MKRVKRNAAPGAIIGYEKKIMIRLASVLFYGFLVSLLTNMAVQRTSLWYWTPLTEGRILKFFALDTDDIKYDVLILGSSISRLGFLPAVFEEELSALLPERPSPQVYNSSVNGALLPAHLEVMRGIAGKHQKPKVVLMLLSIRAFNGAQFFFMPREVRYFSRSPGDVLSILRYSPIASVKWAAIGSFTRGLEAILQIPQFLKKQNMRLVSNFQVRHGSAYFYPFTKAAIRKNKRVYFRPEKSLEKLRKTRGKMIRERDIIDFEITPLIEKWLQGIIIQAKKKGLTIVILLAPESEWLKKNVYYKERLLAVAYLRNFCKREGIAWYDLGKAPFRPDDADYRDGCNHLSPEGAEKLSRVIAREIVAPLLTE